MKGKSHQPNTPAVFSREAFGYARSSPGNHPRKIVRMYVAWVFAKLATGQQVTLPGVGKIQGTFRKGRRLGTDHSIVQPDTYVLRIHPSIQLRAKLRSLAVVNPNAFK